MYVCMHDCMYVCMYMCVYACVCMHVLGGGGGGPRLMSLESVLFVCIYHDHLTHQCSGWPELPGNRVKVQYVRAELEQH